MRDELFIRGKVPMTKAEVRAIVLSKLELSKNSVLYDIGAGTGSVSIEAAMVITDGMVYAIEQKEEATALIRCNCEQFAVKNVTVIHGKAPDALKLLPAPTHVFIGGSAGSMESIIEVVRGKKRDLRVVITAITLETLCSVMAVLKEESITAEVISVQVSKAYDVAGYHMMKGENPIYVITFGGIGDGQS